MSEDDTPLKRIIRSIPGEEGRGKRLDLWLAGRFTYRSRAEWQKAIRQGEILRNRQKVRPSKILTGNETIDFEFQERPEPPVRTDYEVLAEMKEYFVINKPGDLPVHPSGRYFNHTLLMLLRQKSGELFLVNRLDRETSGIVLMAKNPQAAAALSKEIGSRHVRKEYIVYIHGKFPETPLHARGWLSADPDAHVRKKRRFTIEKPDGECEDCDTEFFLEKQCGDIAKVRCLLHTGRLHQIRATLCSSGFPVVGDKLYGLDDRIFARFSDGEMTDEDKKLLITERQALHAEYMEFISPFDGQKMIFHAPLPLELKALENVKGLSKAVTDTAVCTVP